MVVTIKNINEKKQIETVLTDQDHLREKLYISVCQ